MLGLAVTAGLIAHESSASIVDLLRRLGPRVLLLVPLHALPLLLDVAGWRVLIGEPTRAGSLFVIAAIREAINRLLPVANVGGELVGMRLLAQQQVSGAAAVASVTVEMVLHLVALYLYADIGLAFLLRIAGGLRLTGALWTVLAGPLPLVLLIVWLLRSGALFRIAEKLGPTWMKSKSEGFSWKNAAQLDVAIHRLASSHKVLAASVALQLAGMLAGCAETWLVLWWLGHPLSYGGAIALESATLAAKSLIFMAPAGLGVQEAALVGIGHMLGVSGDVAITLSLVKRMREVLFGLPALGIWGLRMHSS